MKRLAEMAEYMEACALIARNGADIHNGSKELREHADMVTAIASYLSSAVETGCVHPLGKLMYHGFVSGRVGDYRCEGCQAIVYLPSLDSREWAAARAEMKGSTPAETRDDDASLRRECVDLAAEQCVSVAGCTGWPLSALLAFKLLCQRSAVKASAPTTCDTKCFGWPRCECGRRMP
jgi:hypothetical protein